MEFSAGIHKAVIIANSAQFGESPKGTPELILGLRLSEGVERSTVLYFSQEAAPYSLEKLRAAGWTGNDLTNLSSIYGKEVSIEISYETYEGKQRMKIQIMGGGGKFETAKPMDPKAWAAKVAALTGTPAPAGAPAPKF